MVPVEGGGGEAVQEEDVFLVWRGGGMVEVAVVKTSGGGELGVG